jgi:hypothetical protein
MDCPANCCCVEVKALHERPEVPMAQGCHADFVEGLVNILHIFLQTENHWQAVANSVDAEFDCKLCEENM